jgi:hypothetical protein
MRSISPSLRRGLGSAVVALVALTLSANVDASTRRTTQVTPTTPRLELVGQSFAFEPDGVIQLRYRLVGIADDALELAAPPAVVEEVAEEAVEAPVDTSTDTGTPTVPVSPEPIPLTIEVTNYAPLTNSRDVDELVGSDVDPDAFAGAIDGVVITDLRERVTVAGDGSIEVTLEIQTDVVDSVEERLKFERPGLYPLRVQLLTGDPRDDNIIATAGTILQRLPGPTEALTPPIDLSVVAVTPAPSPRATSSERAGALTALDDAVDLAAALDVPVTLEVPPTLVAEEAATPAGAERLASSLAGDELVALPVVPLDVSSAVAAGRAETYTRLVNAGEDLLTASVPTAATVRTVWMTTDALSAGGAQQLRDLGVRFVVMPAELYRDTVSPQLPETDLFVDAELPDGGTLPILIVDDRSLQLTPTAADDILATSTATEWSVQTAATILIDRAVADIERIGPPAQRSLILTTPDLATPDARLLAGLVDLVATTPSLRFTAASSLIGVTDTQLDGATPVVIELPDVAGPSLAERVALIDATAARMTAVASMLQPDDPRPTEWANELDALISTAYIDSEVEAATAALVAQADALENAVELPEPFTFTLTGRNGTIEIEIGNSSDEPLNVTMQLESSKVEFPEGDQQVTLRPNDETTIVVPVEARANGTSSISLTVTTPAGDTIDEPVTLTSRVTGFTGLGQLLTGGFILVLLTWWFSHWRSKRRAAADNGGRDRHPTARAVGSDAP